MFPFRQAAQQEVTLPDGRRWTVRVERDNEPVFPENMFRINFWYARWLFARLAFASILRRPSDGVWSSSRTRC